MDQHRLDAALVAYFGSKQADVARVSLPVLDKMLIELQIESKSIDSLLEYVQRSNRGKQLSPIDRGRLGLVDLCFTQKINQGAYPKVIRQELLRLVALIGRRSLQDGFSSFYEDNISIRLLESLMALCIGCQDTSGRVELLMQEKLKASLDAIAWLTRALDEQQSMQNHLLNLLSQDILLFVTEERDRAARLERHLIDAEINRVRTERARHHAALMINQKMQDQHLPETAVRFLQGPWFESINLIVKREGKTSGEFYRVSKLTETLIQILQPENGPIHRPAQNAEPESNRLSSQEFYRIIEHLPEELKSALDRLEPDSERVEMAFSPVESVIVDIMKGKPTTAYVFESLPLLPELLLKNTRVSQSLIDPIAEIQTDQWFVQRLQNKQRRHIKLSLKDDELEYLMFTNLVGAKMLEVNYADFAYLLSVEQIKPLLNEGEMVRQLRLKLKKLLQWHQKQTRIVSDEAVPVSAQSRDAVIDPENYENETSDSRREVLRRIMRLSVGDSMCLGASSDIKVEAKLAVIDPLIDCLILVDLSGAVLDELSRESLVELVITGYCQLNESDTVNQDPFKSSVNSLIERVNTAPLTEVTIDTRELR